MREPGLGLPVVALRAASDRTAAIALGGHSGVAVPAQAMEIVLHPDREFRAILVAEIAVVLSGLVEEIVMTGDALHRRMVLVVEDDRQHRGAHDEARPDLVEPGHSQHQQEDYKQRPTGHG